MYACSHYTEFSGDSSIPVAQRDEAYGYIMKLHPVVTSLNSRRASARPRNFSVLPPLAGSSSRNEDNMRQIITRVVGVSQRNSDGTSRQRILKELGTTGGEVMLNHVLSQDGDLNTIEVLLPGAEGKRPCRVGFLPGRVGDRLARHIDAKRPLTAVISSLVAEGDPPHTSVEVKITF